MSIVESVLNVAFLGHNVARFTGDCCVPPPRPQAAHGLRSLAEQACFVNKQCVLMVSVGGVRSGSECARSLVPRERSSVY